MTRHGKNATASSVYSYQERNKDAKQSGYGTLHERLGADSIKEFDCCALTLQPCRDPVISREGYVFDKEAVLEYIVQQKKEMARKLREWEKQGKRERDEVNKAEEREHEMKVKKFAALEGTPAHPGVAPDLRQFDIPNSSANSTWWSTQKLQRPGQKRKAERSVDYADAAAAADATPRDVGAATPSNKKNVPSFWIPSQIDHAAASKLEKPSQKVLCPMSGQPLRMKDLLPVTFTLIKDGDPNAKWISKKVRYMCPVTRDALTNTTRCVYLKTSGNVVTKACLEKIIRKDMIDPTNGQTLTEDDIIELQRGGTGYASTNDVKAKLIRPQLELQ